MQTNRVNGLRALVRPQPRLRRLLSGSACESAGVVLIKAQPGSAWLPCASVSRLRARF